ncbi:hypothetical protein AB6A40_000129 [Gnathostoma spinigerum]|uniref:Uncharacterized protein n=1 Tax=Gnathostoma spinigerum TaxID=75299 RepID=A0ABD6E2F4_9BILA
MRSSSSSKSEYYNIAQSKVNTHTNPQTSTTPQVRPSRIDAIIASRTAKPVQVDPVTAPKTRSRFLKHQVSMPSASPTELYRQKVTSPSTTALEDRRRDPQESSRGSGYVRKVGGRNSYDLGRDESSLVRNMMHDSKRSQFTKRIDRQNTLPSTDRVSYDRMRSLGMDQNTSEKAGFTSKDSFTKEDASRSKISNYDSWRPQETSKNASDIGTSRKFSLPVPQPTQQGYTSDKYNFARNTPSTSHESTDREKSLKNQERPLGKFEALMFLQRLNQAHKLVDELLRSRGLVYKGDKNFINQWNQVKVKEEQASDSDRESSASDSGLSLDNDYDHSQITDENRKDVSSESTEVTNATAQLEMLFKHIGVLHTQPQSQISAKVSITVRQCQSETINYTKKLRKKLQRSETVGSRPLKTLKFVHKKVYLKQRRALYVEVKLDRSFQRKTAHKRTSLTLYTRSTVHKSCISVVENRKCSPLKNEKKRKFTFRRGRPKVAVEPITSATIMVSFERQSIKHTANIVKPEVISVTEHKSISRNQMATHRQIKFDKSLDTSKDENMGRVEIPRKFLQTLQTFRQTQLENLSSAVDFRRVRGSLRHVRFNEVIRCAVPLDKKSDPRKEWESRLNTRSSWRKFSGTNETQNEKSERSADERESRITSVEYTASIVGGSAFENAAKLEALTKEEIIDRTLIREYRRNLSIPIPRSIIPPTRPSLQPQPIPHSVKVILEQDESVPKATFIKHKTPKMRTVSPDELSNTQSGLFQSEATIKLRPVRNLLARRATIASVPSAQISIPFIPARNSKSQLRTERNTPFGVALKKVDHHVELPEKNVLQRPSSKKPWIPKWRTMEG